MSGFGILFRLFFHVRVPCEIFDLVDHLGYIVFSGSFVE